MVVFDSLELVHNGSQTFFFMDVLLARTSNKKLTEDLTDNSARPLREAVQLRCKPNQTVLSEQMVITLLGLLCVLWNILLP